jgi:cysteine desulfuration protein SufE
MTIQQIQQEIIDEFSFFDDWQQRYEYLIELGKNIPQFNREKSEELLIRGCQSKVWLSADFQEGKIHFSADSDAILPKGIAALLVRIYSGQTPEAIFHSDTKFIEQIGLQEFLSPSRANGLLAMAKQIKYYAIALKTKQNNTNG